MTHFTSAAQYQKKKNLMLLKHNKLNFHIFKSQAYDKGLKSLHQELWRFALKQRCVCVAHF